MDDNQLYIGVNLPAKHGVSDQDVVDAAIAAGYDLITAKITSRTYRKSIQMQYQLHDVETVSLSWKSGSTEPNQNQNGIPSGPQRMPIVRAPTAEDLVVLPGSHVANTIALCAPWIELDSKDSTFAEISFQVLQHELAWARFCGLPYVVLEGPRRRTYVGQYAHALGKLLRSNPQVKIFLHTTFTEEFHEDKPPADMLSTWEVWDAVRCACDYPPNLFVALEVQASRLPDFVVSRWFCEPVAMLILSAPSVFVPNACQFPVLPKHIQQLVLQFAKRQPYFLIKDTTNPTAAFGAGGSNACLVYLRHLCGSLTKADFAQTAFADMLQDPLQPLTQSLDSTVYEVFEQDTVKYDAYFRAISGSLKSPELEGVSQLVVVVAGAGRGALVDRILEACSQMNRQLLTVYAIEKNQAAAAYLMTRASHDKTWLNVVEVVFGDMRFWRPPYRANLIVSELMGSFGDNELAPECLDGIQSILDPQRSIMIPRSCTSFMAPAFSPAVWSKARKADPKQGLHKPYVVCLQYAENAAAPMPVWQFVHPTPSPNTLFPGANQRKAKVAFPITHRTRIYGFSGYFEAELFPGVELSTNPATAAIKSAGLASWFPLWFPLATPLDVQPGTEIDLSVWREVDGNKIWYQWMAETLRREGSRRVRLLGTVFHNTDGHAASYFAS